MGGVMIIIVPCAGRSGRYPTTRPKWMLTQPSGELMVRESLRGLRFRKRDRLIITILKEHEQRYHVIKGMKASFDRRVDVCVLNKQTGSQPETIYQTLMQEKIRLDSSIFIKDSDNYFELEDIEQSGSYVAVNSLNEHNAINPRNKSYVQVNENGIVQQIVEKQVISDLFCVGGYFFKTAKQFISGYKALCPKDHKELYTSDVIGDLISKGQVFLAKKAKKYIDWGTFEEWSRFRMHQKTYIIDLDGVLVKSSAKYFKPYWGTSPGIEQNIRAVNQLKDKGNQIVIFTSRTENFRAITEHQLKKNGLLYDFLFMGALHSQRVLVNDFSSSNPFPSAITINVERDSDQLASFLNYMGAV